MARARARDESDDLAAVQKLEPRWARICSATYEHEEEEWKQLLARWEPLKARDPVVIPVDLLSPIGCARHEPSHTQALAYLLDPEADHGLRHGPLDALLGVVLTSMVEKEADAVTALLDGYESASVVPERLELLRTSESERRARTDLWVEIPATAPNLLLVIEAKIDAQATAGQLRAYEEAIQVRARQLGKHPRVMKVYLTLDADPPRPEAGGTGWIPLAWRDVIASWVELTDGETTAGVEFLRLYAATVLQKLYGLRFASELSVAARRDLADYLWLRLPEEAP